MGIYIYMPISRSVTHEEWRDVYQETLRLVEAFPLAERRTVSLRGIPTSCLVRTEEREFRYGWRDEKVATGWSAHGDYESVHTAEEYHLPRDLVTEDKYEEDAPDPMLSSTIPYLEGHKWKEEECDRCYCLWGEKTQGEPYHMYLLSIACLIASRLGRKVYVHGDITKGQCERAVRMANSCLDQPIHTPDQCDRERLLARIDDFPLTQNEKLQSFVNLYLGKQDAEFGQCIRNHFSEQTCDEYWEHRLQKYQITTGGFDKALKEYLLWGFGLDSLCSFVNFQDDEGKTYYEDFVTTIMDTKLHQRDKDCTDVLEIDPDDEAPYGIASLFAKIAFGGARNKKVDRYIPIEEIRSALSHAIGKYCPVDGLIDEYLQRESVQESLALDGEVSDEDFRAAIEHDPSYVLTEAIKSGVKAYRELDETYDIARSEDLPYYEAGDSVNPNVVDAVGKSFAFYRSTLDEDKYLELMAGTPEERCQWLARMNCSVLLRDKDWEKIYDDVMERPESFARYYPMVRVQVNSDGLRCMVRAFVTNDALYSYASELDVDRAS